MIKFMLSLLFLFEATTYASTQNVTGGNVNFLAKGNPGFMKIQGTSGRGTPKGQMTFEKGSLTGEFTFNLKDLETGIDLRDEHMKEKYLEVEKYPEAKLILDPITGPAPGENVKGSFQGNLTIHGVTKKVSGQYFFQDAKTLRASFPLKVSEFGIDIPSWMGVTVADSVDVEANLKF